MATFLKLCQHVQRYARIGKEAPGTAPVTVTGQTGVNAEIVGWVQDAWEDIQHDQDDWAFRESSGDVPVLANVRDVVVENTLTDYESLRMDTADGCRKFIVLVMPDGVSTQYVYYYRWEDWRGGVYDRSKATGTPGMFTVMPSGELRLWPTPDQNYTLRLAYQRVAQVLSADGDVPSMPDRYHTAIVWKALMYHADTRDKTQEEYQKWERRRRQAMRRIYRDQLPAIHL
jgi:hypothetical protein